MRDPLTGQTVLGGYMRDPETGQTVFGRMRNPTTGQTPFGSATNPANGQTIITADSSPSSPPDDGGQGQALGKLATALLQVYMNRGGFA